MPVLSATVNVPSLDGFGRHVLNQIRDHLEETIRKSLRGIESGVAPVIGNAVRQSPEYQSILGGQLWHELGIVHPEATMSVIISRIQQSIQASGRGVRIVGQGISGSLQIGILPADYSDILSLPEATFTSENGYEVDWLKWLLFSGETLVIRDHWYLGKETPKSRTGRGIMVKSRLGWRVPEEFAGTLTDNWLVRAISKTLPQVGEVAFAEIQRNF